MQRYIFFLELQKYFGMDKLEMYKDCFETN